MKMASVDVGSMPPWKRELLERKRRQEENDKKRQQNENERMSHLPSWKRELMMKKQKQKNTTLFLSKSPSISDVPQADIDVDVQYNEKERNNVDYINEDVLDDGQHLGSISGHTNTQNQSIQHHVGSRSSEPESNTSTIPNEDVSTAVEEHLIPIQQNPWVKHDAGPKHSFRYSSSTSSLKHNENEAPNSISVSGSHSPHEVFSSSSHNSYMDTNDGSVTHVSGQNDSLNDNQDNDSVFGEEEVTYGRGFVHKLLRRFTKHMSTKDEQHNIPTLKISPRRTYSTDHIFDEQQKISPRSPVSADAYADRSLHNGVAKKAVSVDNLLAPSKNFLFDSEESANRSWKTSAEDFVELNRINRLVSDNDTFSGDMTRNDGQNQSDSDDLRKGSIVSAARSVFEKNISVKPVSPNYRKSPGPETSLKTSNAVGTYGLTGPTTNQSHVTTFVDQNYHIGSQNKQSKHADKTREERTGVPNKSQLNPTAITDNNIEIKNKDYDNFSKVKHDSVDQGSTHYVSGEDINANLSSQTDLRTGNSSVTLKSYNGYANSTSYVGTNKIPGSTGTVNASEPFTQDKTAEDRSSQNKYIQSNPPSTDVPAGNKHVASDRTASVPNKISKSDRHQAPEIIKKENSYPDPTEMNDSLHQHEQRNAEANRLNLNLNLNELNKSKNEVSNVDINKNTTTSVPVKPEITPPVTNNVTQLNRKLKKHKPPVSAGPGSLLVRPASNLVAAGTKTEYLNLNQYQDIKQGEFAPANKRPSYYDEDSDDDLPSSNIDDYLPNTNIDDLSPSGTPREGDPSKHKANVRGRKYQFEGAGIIANRSLLKKTRTNKGKQSFGQQLPLVFEYPSEQFLLDTMPAEPGDLDYKDPNAPPPQVPQQNGELSPEMTELTEPGSLKSTPGLGNTGSLGSYQSKNQMEYFFGMERDEPTPTPQKVDSTPTQDDMNVKPADDEDYTWSDDKSSDMLF